MAYTKTLWEDSPNTTTPLNADNLNHMEDGIEANAESISTISDSVTDLDDKIETVNTALAKKENLSNKATSFDNLSADSTTYPTTAAVKKYVNDYCLLAESDDIIATDHLQDGAVTTDKLSDECFDVIPTEDSGNLLSSGTIYSTVYSPLSEKADVETTKNLLVLENGTYESNGITVTVNNNHVTVMGTATATTNIKIPTEIVLDGTYTLSVQNVQATDLGTSVLMLVTSTATISDATTQIYAEDVNTQFTATNTVTYLYVYVSNGGSPNKEFDVQLEQGEEATSFIACTVLQTALNSNSVSEDNLTENLQEKISSIDGKADSTSSKNLLALTNGTYESNGITVTVNNNHVTVTGTATAATNIDCPVNTIELDNNCNYVISVQNIETDTTSTANRVNVLLRRTDTNGDVSSLSSYVVHAATTSSESSAFTEIDGSIENVRFYVGSGGSPNKEFDVQLEQGEEMTDYIAPTVLQTSLSEGCVSEINLSDGLIEKITSSSTITVDNISSDNFDDTPTKSSGNLLTSGTVYTAIQNAVYSAATTITTTTKNILTLEDGTYTSNGITVDVSNGHISISGTSTAVTNINIPTTGEVWIDGTYTLSIQNLTIDNAGSTVISLRDDDGNIIGSTIGAYLDDSSTLYNTFESSGSGETIKYLRIYVGYSDSYTTTPQKDFYVQLENGNEMTDYTNPYIDIVLSPNTKEEVGEYNAIHNCNLYKKSMYVDGDSIAYGSGNGGRSYADIIAEKYSMTLTKTAVGSTTLTVRENADEGKESILERVQATTGDYDYILLEGGINDIAYIGQQSGVILGNITDNFDGEYDTTTIIGALETICYEVCTKWFAAKKLFVLVHKRNHLYYPEDGSTVIVNQRELNEGIISVLKKWGISYVNLSEETNLFEIGEEEEYSQYFGTGDTDLGLHPNELGYNTFFVPLIENKLKSI